MSISHSSIYRIGGRRGPHYRKAATNNALGYCRAIRDYAGVQDCIVSDVSRGSEDISVVGSPDDKAVLEIIVPKAGARVRSIDLVVGSIYGEEAAWEGQKVWVVIRPDYDFFWVQRPADVSNGHWSSKVNFGDPYTKDGHRFTVYAVVDPVEDLAVGQRLAELPAASACAGPISVRFKKSTAGAG